MVKLRAGDGTVSNFILEFIGRQVFVFDWFFQLVTQRLEPFVREGGIWLTQALQILTEYVPAVWPGGIKSEV
jgi:hypothetical protein